MTLKYVMFKKGMYHHPILFFEPITHIGIAEMFTKHEEGKGFIPVSAGEFNTETDKTFGRSSSLNLNSRPEDGKIIYNHEYNFGIY
jgi:hypothetical protein